MQLVIKGGFALVMKDEMQAKDWEWLFVDIFHMRYICYRGYYNAFAWI